MVSIRWFLSQFWKDRNENTRQKLDHENEVMAYEDGRGGWRGWGGGRKAAGQIVSQARRVAAAVTAADFPILFAGPLLSSEWSLTSPLQVLLASAPRKILLCSSWTLYALSAPFNIDLGWIFIDFTLYCDVKKIYFYFWRVYKIDFLKRYCTSPFCMFISRNFLLFEVYVENEIC